RHDRACRTTYVAAAGAVGGDWKAYLQGLARVLHYAEHLEANLVDADGYFRNVFAIVTADGRVSQSELGELIRAADIVYSALKEVFEHRERLALDPKILASLHAESWAKRLEELKLHEPTNDNISSWLQVAGSWVASYSGALHDLRYAA